MKKFLTLSLFVLAFALSGCSNKGASCDNDGDCGGSLICANLTFCGDSCLGICADECDDDADCPGGERCAMEASGDRSYCMSSTAVPEP